MSYSQKKNTSGYVISFAVVGLTIVMAFLANSIIKHKIEENGGNLSNQVVLNETVTNTNNTTATENNNNSNTVENSNTNNMGMSSNMKCNNGTYTSTQTYSVHGKTDTVKTTLVISDDTITDMTMTWVSGNKDSQSWVTNYQSVVSSKIEGQKITDITSAYVSGSTLTSNAFKNAIIDIKSQAKV